MCDVKISDFVGTTSKHHAPTRTVRLTQKDFWPYSSLNVKTGATSSGAQNTETLSTGMKLATATLGKVFASDNVTITITSDALLFQISS